MDKEQEKIFKENLLNDGGFYSNLIQQIELPVITWNQQFIIKNWNPQGAELLGWNKDEVLNKNLFNVLIADENQSITSAKIKKTVARQENKIDFIKLKTKTQVEIVTT